MSADMPKFNVLLLGTIGTGKTTSIRSLVDAGLEVFVLATEPGIHTILGDIPPEKLHWKYITPAKTSWDTLLKNARMVNSYSMEQLQKMASPTRAEYGQFYEVIEACNDFVCDRTGESFGDTEDFGPERAFVIDGLSGLSQMAMDLVCGAKPIKSLPEWLVAQDNLHRFISKLCSDLKCTFVLLSHVEREKDELTGGTFLTVSTLGQKLAPKLLKPFDEVVLAYKDGTDFRWSTTRSGVDLKSRTLPLSDEIEPGFEQLFTLAKKEA